MLIEIEIITEETVYRDLPEEFRRILKMFFPEGLPDLRKTSNELLSVFEVRRVYYDDKACYTAILTADSTVIHVTNSIDDIYSKINQQQT